MAGNTFGQVFKVTTWGESHGPAVGAVIDGCPPRLPLNAAQVQAELARRRPGVQAHATTRIWSRSRTFRATAPAATRATVSRAEARPPPRWSRMPYLA